MEKIRLIGEYYFFNCPNCSEEIIVYVHELNCKIFRHAIYKENYQQVDPHLSFKECSQLISLNLVYGCCKPFEIISKNDELYAIKCEYK